MKRSSIASIGFLLITSGSLSAQEKNPADSAQALIEQLVDVKEPYLGSQFYYAGGGVFLPYAYSTTCRAIKDPNDPLLALVKLGPKAVPALLEHLDDARKTKSTKEHSGGFGFMSISCDEGNEDKVKEKLDNPIFGGFRYTFRVGDFCYAALGQIVNREYDLVQCQPTAIYFLTSVPYTKQIIADLRKEWNGLTTEKHRELLVKGFGIGRHPGASHRLAFYYPELLETHALQQLKQGNYAIIETLHFDRSTKLDNAIRDVLLKIDDDALAAECVKRLVGRGFDKDIEAYIERRSLTAKSDDLKGLKRMLGWTLLHRAVDTDIPALIELALKEKVDVNARSKNGETALHLTTEYGRSEALEMLLRAKADPNIANGAGRLPIEDMAFGDDEECVRKLVAAGSKIPNVYAAVVLNDAGRLAEMLKAKPELANARNRYGEPILQMAAERGDMEIIKLLLDTKAEIDAVGKQTNRGISKQYTALHASVVSGKPQVAKLLLERGANPNISDNWKRTPLHYAAGERNVEIVKLLLAHKADTNLKDSFGDSLWKQTTKEISEAVAEWEKSKK